MAWLGPVLLLGGLAANRLWEQWPSGRMGELLLIALAVLGTATLLKRLVRWSTASLAILLWALLLVVFSGALPVLATILFSIASVALGGLVYRQGPLALQGLLGALLFAGCVGWLLPLPMHRGWLYLLACAALIAWRRQPLADALRSARRQWTDAVAASPRTATFSILVLGLASTGCWLPTLQYDDLAYHLRLPWQLQEQGFYSLDPRFQVWALAPWASDVLHAIPQVMLGAEARGPVNAVWLLVTAAGGWRLAAHMDAAPSASWLAITLFGSLPLTAALAGGMQTELPSAAALVWMLALIAGPRDGSFRWWAVLAILAGGLAAMKLTSAAMAGILLAWALIRHPWPSPSRILAIIAIGLALAGSSYVYAAAITGNPVLPLFNGWFESDYFAATNVIDLRWRTGFNAGMLWNITFDTDQYLETFDGGGGFLLVALAGTWLLSFFRPQTRPAALLATSVLLLPLVPIQYLRYAYPGLVLLAIVLVTAGFQSGVRRFSWLVIGLCVLNLAYQSNSHWTLRTGMLKQTIKVQGRDAPLFEQYAPERLLASTIRESASAGGNVLVLDPAHPYFADLGSRGRTTAWYSPRLAAAAAHADADASGREWVELMRSERIGEVIVRPQNITPAQAQALRAVGAVRKAAIGEAEWWSLPE